MEVVSVSAHSKNSLDFFDTMLEFIKFRPIGCNYLEFQVNIQQKVEITRLTPVVTTLNFK